MGRIKSAMVKRVAKKLILESPQLFNENFEKNKKVLSEVVPHKKTRNAIAGYITRLAKR